MSMETQRKLVAETVVEENRFYNELSTDYTVSFKGNGIERCDRSRTWRENWT